MYKREFVEVELLEEWLCNPPKTKLKLLKIKALELESRNCAKILGDPKPVEIEIEHNKKKK